MLIHKTDTKDYNSKVAESERTWVQALSYNCYSITSIQHAMGLASLYFPNDTKQCLEDNVFKEQVTMDKTCLRGKLRPVSGENLAL